MLNSCGSKMAGGSIDIEDVDSIIITKQYNSVSADTSKRLTNNSIKTFLEKWNNSPSSGPWKFLPNYVLTVYLKNNQQKTFMACGQNIKEKNDWCLDFRDTTYFDNLWFDKKASR